MIHLCVVLFVALAPFSKSCNLVLLHALCIPFMYLHWVTNNDTCALTELEKLLSNKRNNQETFIGSIVSPVYKLENNDLKIASMLLWLISLSRIAGCKKVIHKEIVVPLRLLHTKLFKIKS